MNQQTYQDALYAERQARETAEYDALVNALAAAQGDAEVAQRDFTDAHYRNDGAAMADAQRRMARAESRITTLESGKEAIDAKPTGSYPTQSAAQQYQQPQQWTADQIINSMTQLMPGERKWLQDNKDLLNNPANHTRLQAAYFDAVDKGYERDSPEYIAFIASRLGRGGNGGGGRPHPDMPKVSLTPEEAAKISGVSMEVYRENQQKLQKLKALGMYGDR
jgi:hypothetical protein